MLAILTLTYYLFQGTVMNVIDGQMCQFVTNTMAVLGDVKGGNAGANAMVSDTYMVHI